MPDAPPTKPHEKEEEEALRPRQRMRIFMPRARLNIDAEYHLSLRGQNKRLFRIFWVSLSIHLFFCCCWPAALSLDRKGPVFIPTRVDRNTRTHEDSFLSSPRKNIVCQFCVKISLSERASFDKLIRRKITTVNNERKNPLLAIFGPC